MTGPPTNAAKAWEWYTEMRLYRWLAAGIFVVAVGIIPGLNDTYTLCSDQLAQVGDNPTVRLCGPPEVTDYPVVAGIFLMIVLLAPDLTEVSIGVIGLKQQLRKQQEEVEHKLSEIRTEVVSHQFQMSSSLAVAEAPDLAAVVREMSDWSERLTVQGQPPPTEQNRALEGFVDTMLKLDYAVGGIKSRFAFANRPRLHVSFFVANIDLIDALITRTVELRFNELADLIDSRDVAALSATRSAFIVRFQQPLDTLSLARWLAGYGVRPVDRDLSKGYDLANQLLTALTLEITQLPRKEQPSRGTEAGGTTPVDE